jgi:endonuclease I/methionine-rich copper-binding protein CopC
MTVSRLLLVGALALAATAARADATYHVLADGSFSQNWNNTGLITVTDDWSGVPSIEGYRGDNLTPDTGIDPRTILVFGSSPLNVIANNTDPSGATSGGVYEVEGGDPIAGNPTIAFQGSGTADAPFVLLRLNTTGCTAVNVSYLLRDIDTAETTLAQQVVLQARTGETGDFANVDGTYVAAANNGGSTPGAANLAASFENQAQVQLRWLTTNAANVDAMIGIDDIQVSGTCTGGVDNPPTVSSTTPANNATNVAPSANITIQFSEAVTTNPGWIAFSCTASGNVAATESGTGSSRTLDPLPTLAFGEVCTGTVVAANVIDQDGTPDPMTANSVFSFTVLPDNAPTVAATTPTNGASNVPVSSNLSINFSEPVSVSGSWYSISCANSGAHPGVVTGGPQNYTVNPDTNFELLELCTVTLTAALIVDQDGTPDPLASNYVWTFTSAASAANYYNSVDSSSAAALRASLHTLIDDHIAYRYSIGSNNCNLSEPSTVECDVWDIVESAEQDPGNPNRILDVYRNRTYTKITDRSGNTGPTTYNREHTWPNSLGFNDLNGVDGNNNPYSPYVDGHMLYASASDHNQSRGNKPYDNCSLTATCAGTENVTDANYGFGGGSGTYPGNSNWALGSDGNTGSYEVWNHRKGDMARAILYMDIRYEGGTHANGQPEPDLIVTNNRALVQVTPAGQVPTVGYMAVLDTLIAWHQADPPDANEILRNEIVYGFQGNRNPFIDHPEYAACLWQNACTAGDDIFDNGFE